LVNEAKGEISLMRLEARLSRVRFLSNDSGEISVMLLLFRSSSRRLVQASIQARLLMCCSGTEREISCARSEA
jgi:hypothetical protein